MCDRRIGGVRDWFKLRCSTTSLVPGMEKKRWRDEKKKQKEKKISLSFVFIAINFNCKRAVTVTLYYNGVNVITAFNKKFFRTRSGAVKLFAAH